MRKASRNFFCLFILFFAAACTPAIKDAEPVRWPAPPPAGTADRPEETGAVRPSDEAAKTPEAKAAERRETAGEEKAKEAVRSPFRVTPRGIDFGNIGPGASKESVFNLEFSEVGTLDWVMEGLSDWVTSGAERTLSGRVDRRGAAVKVRLKCLKVGGDTQDEDRRAYPVQLIFENERQILSLEKTLAPGYYGDRIVFVTRAGEEAVSIMFRVVPRIAGPAFAIDPPALDLGTVEAGESLIKRIKVTNKGTGTLRWNAVIKPAVRGRGGAASRGAYVSFLNEEVRKKGAYAPPPQLKDRLEVTGPWAEENGYPLAEGSSEAVLKCQFTGTAVDVIFREGPEMGDLKASVDSRGFMQWSAAAEEQGRKDIKIVEGLPEGPHTITIVPAGGAAVIEGLRVYSRNTRPGPAGWLKVSPDVGTTTREIDFVTIRVQTAGMAPGLYSESVLFRSSEDEAAVEVSLAVSAESTAKIIPVYRYMKGSDQFLTGNPAAEGAGLLKGYRQEGLAFRLFSPGTPGTTEFFRWFNANQGSHYYAIERDKRPPPAGYVRERSIGNIATVKLAGSRELYRWYNPKTRFWYYTTDSGGEGFTKKGFRFDGTAGYVK